MTIRKQNALLCDETAISVTGLRDIHAIITVPGTRHQVSFHRWLLTVKTADESTLLFDAVERDPNEFLAEEMDSVTMDTHPTWSYRAVPTAHTNEAVS
eukprot:10450238-Ditylum_brightwellii.AAC.1